MRSFASLLRASFLSYIIILIFYFLSFKCVVLYESGVLNSVNLYFGKIKDSTSKIYFLQNISRYIFIPPTNRFKYMIINYFIFFYRQNFICEIYLYSIFHDNSANIFLINLIIFIKLMSLVNVM